MHSCWRILSLLDHDAKSKNKIKLTNLADEETSKMSSVNGQTDGINSHLKTGSLDDLQQVLCIGSEPGPTKLLFFPVDVRQGGSYLS